MTKDWEQVVDTYRKTTERLTMELDIKTTQYRSILDDVRAIERELDRVKGERDDAQALLRRVLAMCIPGEPRDGIFTLIIDIKDALRGETP